ncbi:carboxypeptidase regulatory-like domain-containing protein [Pelagicoccus sp. SDUM812003]|uniref:carboxypeptidase regulatory-like domain-containing protein n=1 Tax=Pelagicoccus sp. SDUM812003 TaxID=3041267 RepID=UPI00280EDF0E|nr:carboxypeptidase regulatory-like domain-containing protein [Pelagicoccus sp. SDUM812003]MDQ8202842.1 carboxypeptidase regulatory-like domain-containing protein [Pelagicoccus sp. SDUM812003]
MQATRSILGLAACLGLALSCSEGGDIVGSIQATAPNIETSRSNDSAYQSRRYKFLDTIDYESLRDFVVSIESIEESDQARQNSKLASVSQKDGAFIPHVLPIAAGTEVEWPNRDEIYHNVFSMSEVRPFDLGMYKSEDDPKRLVFDKPGQVDVFCAIHSQMHCIVLVLPNAYFSKSDRRGRFEIKDVPPGSYRLKAWHERLPSKYLDIEVPEQGDLEIDIVMGLLDLPKI